MRRWLLMMVLVGAGACRTPPDDLRGALTVHVVSSHHDISHDVLNIAFDDHPGRILRCGVVRIWFGSGQIDFKSVGGCRWLEPDEP